MSISTRRRIAFIACLSIAGAGLLAGPATAVTLFGTHAGLSRKFPTFHGRIQSRSDFCVARRRVKMFRRRPGKDHLLGKDRSTNAGRWKVQLRAGTGTYYAKVTRLKSAALGIACLADESRKVFVD